MGQRAHKLFEYIATKWPRTIEHCPVKILVERNLPTLQRRNHHLVAVMKFDLVETEMFECPDALSAVPGIAEQHTTHIPEKSFDLRCQVGLREKEDLTRF
jgi:hypothetical protein